MEKWNKPYKSFFFILLFFLSWVILFELARVFFILSTSYTAGELSFQLVLLSLWHGLKMDFSMAAYITVPITLFIMAGAFIPFFKKKRIYIIYTAIILFIQLLIIVADAEIFRAWGSRMDFTPLKYLASPKEMWASISHLPLFWIFLVFLISYLGLFWIFKWIIRKSITLLAVGKYKTLDFLLALVYTGLLVIPIRGGFQLSPLNQSTVVFSNNQYANNAAINASWNFIFSLTKINMLKGNPYEFLSEQEASDNIAPLFTSSGKIEQVVEVSDSLKPNVILIIWESFTEKVLDMKLEESFIVPGFRELIKEGIYFSNCYASGDRTDKGISAILSSYPALPKGSIVNYPGKTAKLPGLGKQFKDNGYHSSFYYGGEPEFANIKSFLSSQNFENFVGKNDFAKKDMNSKWGAHDNVVMKKILGDLPELKQPNFTTWLTLSSHEPFETPTKLFFTKNDIQSRFYNSLHYTDSVIFYFINELKKLPSWNNTLVIISADHGHYIPSTGKRADDFRIPVLWLGGALKKQNINMEKTVSQLDIAGTLVQQLGFPKGSFPFSKNLFDSSSQGWTFFTFNDGIGYVTDSSRIIFDNSGKRVVYEEGKTNNKQAVTARMLMQVVYADFLKR